MSEPKRNAGVIQLPNSGETHSLGEKKRRVDIDIIRTAACFFVVFHHTRGYQAFGHADSFPAAWGYSLLSILTRMDVPLFFMISGALLLRDKQESYRYIFRHRILKIVILLPVLTSMLTAIGAIRGYIDGFSVETCIRFTLNDAGSVGGMLYWYLYSYIGILLLLPYYRRMANGMKKQDFLMLFFIHLFFRSFLEIFNSLLVSNGIMEIAINTSLNNSVSLALEQQLFYPLMGYYLDQKVDLRRVPSKKLFLVLASGVAGIFITSVMKLGELKNNGIGFSEEYLTLFDYLTAICVFLLVKYICLKHNQFSSAKCFVKAVTVLGSLTFGMYIFEPFTKWVIYSRLVALINSNTYLLYPNIIYCILSMTITGYVTWCLKKIPYVKKLF